MVHTTKTQRQKSSKTQYITALNKSVRQGLASTTQINVSPCDASSRQRELAPALQRPPSPPGHYGAIEVSVYGVRNFYAGVLQDDLKQYEFQVRAQTKEWNIRQFYSLGSIIPILAKQSRWKEVQKMYGDMLDFVVPMLHERNPILVVCLLQICCRFLREGQQAVLQSFLTFVAKMAAAKGLDAHPLRLVSSGWAGSGEHVKTLLTVSAREAVDILTERLGPDHAQTLSAKRAMYTSLSTVGDHAGALEVVRRLADQEDKLYPGTYMRFDAELRIAYELLHLQDVAAAAESIETIETLLQSGKFGEYELKASKRQFGAVKAELLRQQGDPMALFLLEDALKDIRATYEKADRWTYLVTERHLAYARLSLNGETPLEPFRFCP